MRNLLAATLCAVLLPVAAQAGWREDASAFDVNRLAQLNASRDRGLGDARNAAPGDLAAIRSVLSPAIRSTDGAGIAGNWRCRTMKLGGLTPAIVYGWFNCRVSNRNGGLFFEKTSGSQRMQGYLYPESGAFIYLGAASVSGEPAHVYSGAGASVGAPGTPDDQAGVFSLLNDGRARLELPAPVQESTFDVIELRR